MDLNEINNLYIEDYINKTGRTTRKNITCIYPENHKRGDKNPSMGYMQKVKKYHCLTCNKNADLLDLVKYDYSITGDIEAINKIKEIYQINDNDFKAPKGRFKDDLTQYNTFTPHTPKNTLESPLNENNDYNFNNQLDEAIKNAYLNDQLAYKHFKEDRGLNEDIIKDYKLTFTLNFNDIMADYKDLQKDNIKPNEYKGVYILPFTDEEGKTIYYMGEPIKRGQQVNGITINKYIKPKGIYAPLFNERYLKTHKEVIFITEGIYDALSVESAGGQAIALNGVANSRFKKLLEAYKSKSIFILMLDNDEAGTNASKEISNILDSLNIQYISYIQDIQNIQDLKECKDANEMILKNKSLFTGLITDLINKGKEIIKQEREAQMEIYEKQTAFNYLSTFIDRVKQDTYKPKATGFSSLDEILDGGLTSQSIAVIGGGSSTGKTTYTLQLIDNMLNKNKCLYFSLEMAKDQIISKVLSKIAYEKGYKLEANKIMQGYLWDTKTESEIKSVIELYQERSKNLIIINPHTPTIDEIIKLANDYKEKTQTSPIIVIDYLQLIQGNTGEDTATIIKRATKLLKNYAIDNDTIVFILTAFNRETTKGNNKTTLESGRDTSDIEYSSDYYISLNFTEYEEGKSNEDINDLKQRTPRQMTVKVLKNRLGRTGNKVNYNYYSAYNYFEEAKEQRTIKQGKAF